MEQVLDVYRTVHDAKMKLKEQIHDIARDKDLEKDSKNRIISSNMMMIEGINIALNAISSKFDKSSKYEKCNVIIKNGEDAIQPAIFIICEDNIYMITITTDHKFKISHEGIVGEKYDENGIWVEKQADNNQTQKLNCDSCNARCNHETCPCLDENDKCPQNSKFKGGK